MRLPFPKRAPPAWPLLRPDRTRWSPLPASPHLIDQFIMTPAKRLGSCTCALRSHLSVRPAARSLPPIGSTSAALHTSSPTRLQPTASTSSDLPWFVSPSSLPTTPTSAPLATAPVPLPAPAHVPAALHPLWDHLSISPFLNKDEVRFIDARRLDGGEAWVEWVVVASLRRGRERGLRGAIEGVRKFVSARGPLAVTSAAFIYADTPAPPRSCPRTRLTSPRPPSRPRSPSRPRTPPSPGSPLLPLATRARGRSSKRARGPGCRRGSRRAGGRCSTRGT